MKRVSLLSLLSILLITILMSCSDSTGSSGTGETTKPPAGKWVFVKDSVITISENTTTTLGQKTTETQIDTTVEVSEDTTEIYVTTEDSITVWMNVDTATVITTYDNDLTFGEGILAAVTLQDVEDTVNATIDMLTASLGLFAEDLKVEVGDIVVGNPSMKTEGETLLVVYTAKTTLKITGTIFTVPTTIDSKVTSTNYATYQKYTGDVPPASWPLNQIKVD